jgi:hypothetical protein
MPEKLAVKQKASARMPSAVLYPNFAVTDEKRMSPTKD